MGKAEVISKEELLNALNEVKGRTAEFDADKYGFSYTTATNEAKRRGYSDDWHDPADLHPDREPEDKVKKIYLNSTEDTSRQTILMSKAVFERYKDKLGGIRGASALVDYAITRLMDELEEGIIEPRIKL